MFWRQKKSFICIIELWPYVEIYYLSFVLVVYSRMELHKTQKQETIRDQSRLSTNHPTLEEGGNLLLHPNYGAACPVSSFSCAFNECGVFICVIHFRWNWSIDFDHNQWEIWRIMITTITKISKKSKSKSISCRSTHF